MSAASLQSLHGWLAGPLEGLLVVAVEVAVLGALALTLERVLARRIRPSLRAALVAAVLVRAAVPVHVEVEGTTMARPSFSPGAPEPPVQDAVATAPRPDVEISSAVVMATEEPRPSRPERGPKASAGSRERAAGFAGSPRAPRRKAVPAPWRAWLALTWAAVAMVLLVRLVLGERRLRALLRAAHPASDRITGLVQDLRRDLGLRRAPQCLTVEAIGPAAVHGALRPRLLVHPGTDALPEAALRAVLTHELLHVKRRDLVWAPLLALLQVLWWPHPLVHLLGRRLRDVIEEARDAETCELETRTRTPKARLAYARLLLDLADAGQRRPLDPTASPIPSLDAVASDAAGLLPFALRGRALTRRITMIFDPPRTHPLATALGASALSAVVWFGFVAAKAPSAVAATEDRSGNDRVVVERQGPLPDWQAAIMARLSETIDHIEIDAPNVREAMVQFAEATGLGAVLHEDAELSWPVTFRAQQVTLGEVLDLITRHLDHGGWSLADGAVHVGQADDLKRRLELRLYRVEPVIRALNDGLVGDDRMEPDDLLHAVMNLSTLGDFSPFDLEGVSIDFWRGLLAVRTCDRHHRTIHQNLERLLDGSPEPDRSGTAWRAPLVAALEAPCACDPADFDNDGALLRWLVTEGGGLIDPVVLADTEDVMGELESSSHATSLREGTPIHELLDAMFAEQGLFVEVTSGVVVVSDRPRVAHHFYDLRPFLDATDAGVASLADELTDFLQADVSPRTWDDVVTCFSTNVGNQLVVAQLDREQAQVKALLDQLLRAVSGH